MIAEISGYEKLYTISNSGIVTSVARVILNKNGAPQRYPQKELKPDIGKYNHRRVTLCRDHKTERLLIHQLVAKHFIPNPDNKPIAHHMDNDPSNNNDWNLEWCTHAENINAQSKGGKNSGISGIKAKKLMNSLIGNIYGCWLVLSFDEQRNGQKYFNVKCTVCGNAVTRAQAYFTNKNTMTPNCIKCKKR